TLLAAGCLGSLWLALQLILHPKITSCPAQSSRNIGRKTIAALAMLLPVGLMASIWTLVFFIW
ncbi:MAG: hypothetical protein ACD_10C00226G0001, partial [uncultured bacterium]